MQWFSTTAPACAAGAGLVLSSLIASPATAAVMSLGTSRDNTLYSSTSDSRSNGAGSHFFTGVTSQGGIRRGLIAFDVSTIPAGSTINAVTLTLHMSRTIALPETVGLHRVLADWGEGASNANNEEGTGASAQPGDATWLHRFFNTSLWSSTGGDFDSIPSAAAVVGAEGYYAWSSPGLITDVQSWVNASAVNHGWLALCNESVQATAKRFDTRENPTPEYRPVLTIDYTPIPEPTMPGPILGLWLIVTVRRRPALQAGVHRFALQSQHAEHTLVHSTQRLATHKAL